MAKIAAIEFDEKIARVLIARSAGSGLQLSSAFEVDFESNLEEDGAGFGEDFSRALGNRVGRSDALISFGRGLSELRVINVPVVPDSELPEIVRFQALRQFANCADDAPVDFLTLSETGEEKKVLAATVPKLIVDNLKTGCQAAGLTVKGVKLRATCTTALSQASGLDHKNYIIVDPSSNSFNIEVVAYGKLCLTRTIRSASGDRGTQISREIRRTLAAANNQIPDYEAKSVVVFGEEKDFDGLRKAIEDDLRYDVEFINPFDHVDGLSSPPENVGHYASLVGLLVDHVSKSTETIDFINPRKKSVDAGSSRTKILSLAAAALLVLGLGGLGYLALAQKTTRINKIKEQIASMQANDNIAQEIIGDVGKIETFENGQAVWLRELANISERFLDPDHAILNSVTFSLNPRSEEEGARIEASGYLQSGDISEQIANKLRSKDGYDAKLQNVVMLSEKERSQDLYSHSFKAQVTRTAELLYPEVSEEEMTLFMEPRRKMGQKEIETSKKKNDQGPLEGDAESPDTREDRSAKSDTDGEDVNPGERDEKTEDAPDQEDDQRDDENKEEEEEEGVEQ
ncbi:MAG: hypothetical protein VX768_06110 [Planctomycetota bacterium]|nr:hypothetical protein [Planctomycetota bacterium]